MKRAPLSEEEGSFATPQAGDEAVARTGNEVAGHTAAGTEAASASDVRIQEAAARTGDGSTVAAAGSTVAAVTAAPSPWMLLAATA